jgi:tripartite-type tricarboxylate transporter receptor subunit TctC
MTRTVTRCRQDHSSMLLALFVPLALLGSGCAGTKGDRNDAQEYPTKPISIVVPFGPGGHSDLVSRPLTSVAQKYLGQPLLIEMKPGGQGIIGTEFAARSRADGYTLLSTGPGWNAALPALEGRSKGPDDLEPVCRISQESTFLTVRADSPHKSLRDLVEFAKANPGKVTVGIGGPYTTSETFWRWLRKTQGISTRLVKFGGGGAQMMLAGLGGHIDVFGGSPVSVSEQVRAGRIRPLVYYGEKRHPDFPDVPTAREEGFDIVLEIWNGLAAPKGTPRAVIDKLDAAMQKILADPTVVEMMDKTGEHVDYLGPDEFGKLWRKDYQFFLSMKDAYAIKAPVEEVPNTDSQDPAK